MLIVKLVVTISIALVFIVGGGVIVGIAPGIIHQLVRDSLILDTPTSMTYKSFKNNSDSVNVYTVYHLFNLTNWVDVVFNGQDPILQEVGPYVYLTVKWRDEANISWHPDATISYNYHTHYEFLPEMSVGDVNVDLVTTPDLGKIGVLKNMTNNHTLHPILMDLAYFLLPNAFITLTVQEVLFGYRNLFLLEVDAILKSVNRSGYDPVVNLQTQDDNQTVTALTAQFTGGQASPDLPQVSDRDINKLTQWAGFKVLPYWNTSYANMINGTDGSVFYPGITESDRPYVFVDSLYRSTVLSSRGTTEFKGVDLIRFTLSRETMLDYHHNPANEAFYMDTTGFIAQPPMYNHPIWISKPYFLDANQSEVHVTTIPNDGNDRERYDTYICAEPITGEVFKVNKRVQINTKFILNETVPASYASTTWYPVAWLEERMEMPDNLVDKFKHSILLPLHAAIGSGIAAVCVGGLMILLGVPLIVVLDRRARRSLIPEEDRLRDNLNNVKYATI